MFLLTLFSASFLRKELAPFEPLCSLYGNAVLCGKCFYLCFCHMTRCKRADNTIFSQRFSPRPVDMKVILICSVEYLGDTVIAGKFQKFPK